MKKLILLLIVLLLLLGAIGGGAYYYFFKRPTDETATEEVVSEPLPEFEEIDSLSIPVIRNGSVKKFVLLKVAVELTDGDYRTRVQSYMPRLKDAYLRELHGYFATVPVDDPVNVRAVATRLMKASAVYWGKVS